VVGQFAAAAAVDLIEGNTMSKPRSANRRAGRSPIALGSSLSQQMNKALFELLTRLGDEEDASPAQLLVARAPKSVAPDRLARMRPGDAAAQEQLRATYEECLRTYRSVVRVKDAGLETDDAGAALAFFVAANLYALTDVEATPEILARLERQLGVLARVTSAWDTAPMAQRQIYFEQLATVGVFVAAMAQHAKSQGLDAIAAVQRAARGYLQHVLGLDPDLLTLGPDGLALRSAQRNGQLASKTSLH